MKRRAGPLDFLLLLSILLVAGYFLFTKIDLSTAPAEDAAMLMRYAQHFSAGQGIVWNVGEAPVDGATDFLFMAVLGGLYRLGVGLEDGVRGLGIAAHALTLVIVYFGSLRMSSGRRWAAWLSAAFLAVGPGLRYVEASFGTPFFALFVALTWLFAIQASDEPASHGKAFLFALSSLLAGLVRPEGVLVGGLMMLAVLVRIGFKDSRRILFAYLAVNLLLGGAYFLWRWGYFGYPLPNPFYKKGGGSFYGASLGQALRNALDMSKPFWLAYLFGAALWVWLGVKALSKFGPSLGRWFAAAGSFDLKPVITILRFGAGLCLAGFILGLTRASSALNPLLILGRYSPAYFAFLLALLATAGLAWAAQGWLSRSARQILPKLTGELAALPSGPASSRLRAAARQVLFLILPAAGYLLMWGLLSDEMNYLGRFQYALLPVVLISWPGFFVDFDAAWAGAIDIDFKPAGKMLAGIVFLLAAFLVLNGRYQDSLLTYQRDGRFDLGQELSAFDGKHYTLATTEAGLLPLYSGWRAVDAWGLNDSWIAHNGGIDAAYLDRYRPEVIMFHADFSPILPLPEEENDAWHRMVAVLKRYAEDRRYVLAAVYGVNPRDTHYYYVKSDFPDSAAVQQVIRGMEAKGYYYGGRCLNFIDYQRSENVR